MTIRIIPPGTALYEVSKKFRNEYLRKPLGLELSTEDTAGEESQFHIAALSKDISDNDFIDADLHMLGIVIINPLSKDVANLRQMAICPTQRGTGLGRKLMGFAEKFAKDKGHKTIELCARLDVKGFYASLGYEEHGDIYEQIGIHHITMKKNL